jgi:hypothetical protein
MSTVHCNTIQTSSGGPVTLTKQSAAKAWNRISISGGTPSTDDSLNASSVTDVAAGKYQTNLASNMANTNYLASNFSSYQSTSIDLDRYGTGAFSGGGNDSRATTGAQVCGYYNGGFQDCITAGTMALGDLA